MYLHRLVGAIASMTASLGGLDVVVFTGGVGERSAEVRRRAAGQLAYLGVQLDEAARLKAESDRSVVAYETSLAAARADAQAVAQRARDEVTKASEMRRKTLEGELAARLDESERAIRTRKGEAMTNVQAIAAEAAAAIVERLTGRAPAPGSVEAALAGAGVPPGARILR